MAKIFLIIFTLSFALISFDLFLKRSLPLVKLKPLPKQYRSDEFVFLRTFYLLKEGENYYTAFNKSVTEDIRGGYLTKEVFTWRLPTIFYFWALFTNTGLGIGILFIILSSLTLICVYKITKNFSSPAILVPYYLDAYYYQTSFLFTEWWALFFFIFGLTALLNNLKKFAIIFLSLSILTRELFILPILFMTIVSFVFKTNRLIFLKIFFIFLVFYSVHYALVQNQPVSESQRDIFSRIHMFDFKQFQHEIAFSMRQYPFLNFRLPLIIVASTPLILLLKFIYSKKLKYPYLLSSISLLFLTPFTGNIYNDYWGITFMPLSLAFFPLVFSLKDH